MLKVYRYRRLVGGTVAVLSDAAVYLLAMLLMSAGLAQVARLAL